MSRLDLWFWLRCILDSCVGGLGRVKFLVASGWLQVAQLPRHTASGRVGLKFGRHLNKKLCRCQCGRPDCHLQNRISADSNHIKETWFLQHHFLCLGHSCIMFLTYDDRLQRLMTKCPCCAAPEKNQILNFGRLPVARVLSCNRLVHRMLSYSSTRKCYWHTFIDPIVHHLSWHQVDSSANSVIHEIRTRSS